MSMSERVKLNISAFSAILAGLDDLGMVIKFRCTLQRIKICAQDLLYLINDKCKL